MQNIEEALAALDAVLAGFLFDHLGDKIPPVPDGWVYNRNEWED